MDHSFIEELDEALLDPITYQAMEDPVVSPEGVSYERSSILKWLSEHDKCPITRTPLRASDLKSNLVLKKVCSIVAARKAPPSAAQEGTMASGSDLANVLSDLQDARVSIEALNEQIAAIGEEAASISSTKARLSEASDDAMTIVQQKKKAAEMANYDRLETARWLEVQELRSEVVDLEAWAAESAKTFDEASMTILGLIAKRDAPVELDDEARVATIRRSLARLDKERANGHMKRGDFGAALVHYKAAIQKLLPDQKASYHTNLAICHMQLKNYHSALSEAEAAINIDPGWVKAYRIVGAAWLRLGEVGKALTEGYGRAIEVQPHDPEANRWFNILNEQVTAAAREKEQAQAQAGAQPFAELFESMANGRMGGLGEAFVSFISNSHQALRSGLMNWGRRSTHRDSDDMV